MKRLILALVIAAVAGIVIWKTMNRPPSAPATTTTAATNTAATASGRPAFYLFRDPSDEDEGCRRIYAFADRAERELAGKIDVKRPDVKSEKSIVDRYQVRVLPTILVVGADGAVKERFEGEDKSTAASIEQALAKLKAQLK